MDKPAGGGAPAPAAAARVRPATEADLDAVVDVIWEVAAEGRWLGTEVPFDRAERRRRLAERVRGGRSLLLVAEAEGTVVGQLTSDVAPFGVADLGMAVRRRWRGKGLGHALLEAAIAWAPTAGAHKMALEVWPDNTAAIALYRRMGFVEEGVRRRHYPRSNGELWSSLLMGRQLIGPRWPLRPAVDDDGWDLVALVAACWSEYPGCVMDPHGEEPGLLAPATAWAEKGGRFWVVEGAAGGLVGSVGVVCGQDRAEVQKLYVGRRQRRRGLGRILLACAEDEARRAGAAVMEAWSDTRFADAHRFYQANGYRRRPETRAVADLSATVEAHFEKELRPTGRGQDGDGRGRHQR